MILLFAVFVVISVFSLFSFQEAINITLDHKCKIFQALNGAVGMLSKYWIAHVYKWTPIFSAVLFCIHFGPMIKIYCVDIGTFKKYQT